MILPCLCYTYIHPAVSDLLQLHAVVFTVKKQKKKTVSHTTAAALTGFMSSCQALWSS